MNDLTFNIKIREETAKKLKAMKITSLETYDEIINRLISVVEKRGVRFVDL